MLRRNICNILLTLAGTLCLVGDSVGEVSFRRDVAPILLNRCLACHNQVTKEGGYSVASYQSLLVAGDSEEMPIATANSTANKTNGAVAAADKVGLGELLRRLVTEDEGERMPLDADPLPTGEVELVRQWLREGAKFDGVDPMATLSSILPIARHPLPPANYSHPLPLTAIASASVSATSSESSISPRLYVGGYHELLQVRMSDQPLVRRRIQQTGERIYDIALLNSNSAGDRIYVASGTPGKLGELRVFASTGDLIGVPLVTTEAMFALALPSSSASDAWIAVAGGDRSIYLIDATSNTVVKKYSSHSDWVRAVCWSDDGTRLASASRDKTVKLFDPTIDQPIDTFSGHGADVVDVCFVPEKSDQLVSCDAEGGVHFWKAVGGDKAKFKKAKLKATHAFALAADNDGVWVSSGQLRGKFAKYSLTKFDWSGKTVIKSYELPARGVSIAVAGSQRVCVGLIDGRLWCLEAAGVRTIDVLPRSRS